MCVRTVFLCHVRCKSLSVSRSQFGNEVEQLEWAKRESKREEERMRRLRLQEQQDLELALALSRVDTSRT